MDDFVRSYHDEFKPWTNKDPSILSSLGPLSERVNCSLMIVNEVTRNNIVCIYYCYYYYYYVLVVGKLLETARNLYPMDDQCQEQKYITKRYDYNYHASHNYTC